MTRAASVSCTRPYFARCRLVLELFEASRCRRDACENKILPVPVILNRLATAFLVLLREMAFGMGGRKVESALEKAREKWGL